MKRREFITLLDGAVAARGEGVRVLGAAKRVVDALVRHDLVKTGDQRCGGEAAGN